MKPRLFPKLLLWFFVQSAILYGYVRVLPSLHITEKNWLYYVYIGFFVVLNLGSWVWLILVIVRHIDKKSPKPKQAGKDLKSPQIAKEEATLHALSLKTHGHDLVIVNPFRSILVMGGAGSGKSESIGRQLMKSAIEQGYCGLLYDFKHPTLTNELEGYLKGKNGRFAHYNVNFTDLKTTSRVNPLHPRYIPNASYAREYAISIINNLLPESLEKRDFWIRSTTDLLTAAIYFFSRHAPTSISTLPHIVGFFMQDERPIIELLSSDLQCLGMVKSLETALRNESNQQLTGVFSTLQSALSVLNTPEIFYVFSADSVPLDLNNKQRPIWLSLGNSADIPETYSPLLSLVTTVCLKQMNQPGRHHSIVILDEAPTLYIPKLERVPATARSNYVSVAFFAQDLSQVIAQYGDKQADAILSNLNNQFYGRVSHPKTAEHVSKIFGKSDVTYTTHGENRGRNSNLGLGVGVGSSSGRTTNESIQERERIKPQDVIGFEVGQFCGIMAEGKNREFNTRFRRIEATPAALPPIPSAQAAKDSLFEQIHQQSREFTKTKLGHVSTPKNLDTPVSGAEINKKVILGRGGDSQTIP